MSGKEIFVCLLGAAVLLSVTNAESCLGDSVGKLLDSCRALKQCPDGWVANRRTGSCYWYNTEVLNFADARAKCQSLGGDLAVLKTKEEMGFAYDYALEANTGPWNRYWIGLERYHQNEWKWLDGDMLSITAQAFWHPDEPNNAGSDENAVHVFENGLANDVAKWREYHSMCEKEM